MSKIDVLIFEADFIRRELWLETLGDRLTDTYLALLDVAAEDGVDLAAAVSTYACGLRGAKQPVEETQETLSKMDCVRRAGNNRLDFAVGIHRKVAALARMHISEPELLDAAFAEIYIALIALASFAEIEFEHEATP